MTMTRFGEFTLMRALGESSVAEYFEASHDVEGGPFFLKRYPRAPPRYASALERRCEALLAVHHQNLAPHLGHGDVDGVWFTVAPLLEGIDLESFLDSCRKRRVVLKWDLALYIVREVARAVASLHAVPTAGEQAFCHGEVCARHVRLGPAGEVWLTGLSSPRGGADPLQPTDPALDGAGLGALVYDLAPLTRAGAVRGPLPAALDGLVRCTLGIGNPARELLPAAVATRIDEVAGAMGLAPLGPSLLAEAVGRAVHHDRARRDLTAADALPTLEPIFDARTEAVQPVSERSGEALSPVFKTSLLQPPTLPGDEFEELPPASAPAPRLPAPPLRSLQGPLPSPVQFEEKAEAFEVAIPTRGKPGLRSLLADAPAEVSTVSAEVPPVFAGRPAPPAHKAEEPLVLLCMADDADLGLFGGRLVVEGFRVEHAADLPTASLRISAEPPAAVILAIDLPGAAQLLTWARKQQSTAALPIFVTGDGDHEEGVAELLELGAEDFFERPVRMNVAIAKLRRVIERRPVPAGNPHGGEGGLDPFAPAEASASALGQPTGVMGTLRQMAITEIVQSLELGRKSARIEIVPSQGERGQLGFWEGRVVFAQCGAATGETAFYALAQYREGFFRIRYGEAPAERNIDQTTTYLLLEAMRQVDESSPAEATARSSVNDDTPTPFD